MEEVESIIERISASLSGTYEEFPLSVSIGIAQTAVVGLEYNRLFHAADQALYSAKRAGGKRYCFYDESMKDMLSVISPIDSDEAQSSNQATKEEPVHDITRVLHSPGR